MTYNVFSGTLNPAQSINQYIPLGSNRWKDGSEDRIITLRKGVRKVHSMPG